MMFDPLHTTTVTLPTVYGSWRQSVHQALMDMLTAFRAAAVTKGVVHAAYHTLPDNLTGESPFTYIGDFEETIDLGAWIRTTTFSGTIGYVDWMDDRNVLDDHINQFGDLMRDLFTVNYNVCPPGILSITDFDKGAKELSQGVIAYGHAEFRWEFTVQEGYR